MNTTFLFLSPLVSTPPPPSVYWDAAMLPHLLFSHPIMSERCCSWRVSHVPANWRNADESPLKMQKSSNANTKKNIPNFCIQSRFLNFHWEICVNVTVTDNGLFLFDMQLQASSSSLQYVWSKWAWVIYFKSKTVQESCQQLWLDF